MKPGLSVVIAARNAAGTIGEQLAALVEQPWPTLGEVIVADNGSDDETAMIAASYAGGPVAVSVVPSGDQPGAGFARNCGVAAAAYERIAFCDADDVVHGRWVESMWAALTESVAVGGSLEFDRLNPEWVVGSRGRLLASDQLPLFDDTFPVLSSCNLGIHRSTFLALGGFDTGYLRGQDAELSLRLHRHGITARFADDVIVHYRMRQSVGEVFRQARTWGEVQVRLRAELGSDAMHPEVAKARARRSWVWLASRTPLLASKAGRARWAYIAGLRVGVRHATRQLAAKSSVAAA